MARTFSSRHCPQAALVGVANRIIANGRKPRGEQGMEWQQAGIAKVEAGPAVPALGVRTNGVRRPSQPSSTARELCSAKPIETAKNNKKKPG